MTETPAQPGSNSPRRPAQRATWHLSDLESFAGRWDVSPAVIRAAMRHANATDVAQPDQARRMVDDFLKLDVRTLEKAQDERLAKERSAR